MDNFILRGYCVHFWPQCKKLAELWRYKYNHFMPWFITAHMHRGSDGEACEPPRAQGRQEDEWINRGSPLIHTCLCFCPGTWERLKITMICVWLLNAFTSCASCPGGCGILCSTLHSCSVNVHWYNGTYAFTGNLISQMTIQKNKQNLTLQKETVI